jgi:catechol 2,3-dioxygenase-like lactoylglutathione lyase family enzyme
MRLNHINLPVEDVNLARDFFARYFGMKLIFELPKNNLAMMRRPGRVLRRSRLPGQQAHLSLVFTTLQSAGKIIAAS